MDGKKEPVSFPSQENIIISVSVLQPFSSAFFFRTVIDLSLGVTFLSPPRDENEIFLSFQSPAFLSETVRLGQRPPGPLACVLTNVISELIEIWHKSVTDPRPREETADLSILVREMETWEKPRYIFYYLGNREVRVGRKWTGQINSLATLNMLVI